MNVAALFVVSSLFLLSACGPSSFQETSGALAQEKSLRIVAQGVSQVEVKALALEKPFLDYRVLSHRHKLVEFYGLSMDELQTRFPRAEFALNVSLKLTEILIDQENKKNFQVVDNPQMLSLDPQGDIEVPPFFKEHLSLIQVDKAWEFSKKSGAGVVVAVVDTGVDYNHLHLNNNYWRNSREIPNNNIDDDKNGYVDDVLGYDFKDDDAYPFDTTGHGSHVAGLIVGAGFGVAQNAQIMGVRVGSTGGAMASVLAGIYYAVDNGAHIINLSMGMNVSGLSSEKVQEIETLLGKALRYMESKNVLLVVPSGNGNRLEWATDIDKQGQAIYPASLPNDNILVVGAGGYQLSGDGELEYQPLTQYSNFGAKSVDVTAPGGTLDFPVYSTALENPHNILFTSSKGTSTAAPLVSGLLAVLLGEDFSLTYEELKELVIEGGDKLEGLEKETLGGVVINVFSSLEKLHENTLVRMPQP